MLLKKTEQNIQKMFNNEWWHNEWHNASLITLLLS